MLECDSEKQEEFINDENLIRINSIVFKGKNLDTWEQELTIIIPPLPISTLQINKIVANLNNKYQVAYNLFSELQVLYSSLNRKFNSAKAEVIDAKVSELKEAGGRMPSKEILETISLNNDNVKAIDDELCKIILIRDFFEYHKIKLEKIMQLVLNISFSASQNDRLYNRTEGAGSGL